MKYTYVEIKNEENETIAISRSDHWSIPLDDSNADYQRYLRWLENPDADESGTL